MAFKEEKHQLKYDLEDHLFTHADDHTLEDLPIHHYHRDIVHSTPEHFDSELEGHAYAHHHDYRYYKYQLALPEK